MEVYEIILLEKDQDIQRSPFSTQETSITLHMSIK